MRNAERIKQAASAVDVAFLEWIQHWALGVKPSYPRRVHTSLGQ